MESLLVIGALVLLGLPVATLYLLISHHKLKGRVAGLEAALAGQADPRPDPVVQRATAAKPPPLPETPVAGQAWQRPPPVPQAPSAGGIVVNARNAQKILSWMMQNWFYVVSAASLALAGIFLVIYGAEQGYMPPAVRIAMAMLLGGGLVAAAEVIRRRFGDHAGSSTAYLPSTLASAGFVTLFGAILAARQLYGFIGPELALTCLAAVALVAIVFGWFYGPLLAAVGVMGATLAPFVIGGTSQNPTWLLVYFLLVSILGLAIDTLQRWGWISILSLICGFGSGVVLALVGGPLVAPFFMPYAVALVVAAIAIPVRSLAPDHDGPLLSLSLLARGRDGGASFPVRLAGGTVAAACFAIVRLSIDVVHDGIFWAAILSLALLLGALIVWARRAPALADLAGLPAIAMVITIAMNARTWAAQAVDTEVFDAPVPKMVSIIVVIAAALSLAAAWRSLRGGQAAVFMAALAALFAPAVAIAIELCWQPADSLGTYFWALHAMTLAAIMVWMAERFARADGENDRLRMSFAVLSALSCVTFGMVIMFTDAALTTAIAVAVVAAAALDHRFKLPLMGSFILAGVSATGYRLVADPGVDWAVQTSWPQMLFVTGGVVVAFLATWILVAEAQRRRLAILMESATVSATGIFLTLVLVRGAIDIFGPRESDIPWMPGVMAAVWLLLGFSQLRRIDMKGWLVWIRTALPVAFLLVGALCIVMSIAFTPLDGTTFRVEGPILVNTLILAYLLPALVLLMGSVWLTGQPRWSRMLFRAAGLALATIWAGHVIRHAWRGPDAMMLPGVGQGEMITYTIVILAVGAGLFYQSLARRSVSLRRWGLIVIGVAVAKVFLVDIGEMNGLVRVGALLLLGLSLAGLAWVNRWATEWTENLERTSRREEF